MAALMMGELIPKERRGTGAQRDGRMVVEGCGDGDDEVVVGSLGASDGWCGDGGGQGDRGDLEVTG